ncbi:MAG: RHS repeat protein [Lachnospiraceae bacterium]|nr:RHS repeat protein [Lachnospiraceae bacterium]
MDENNLNENNVNVPETVTETADAAETKLRSTKSLIIAIVAAVLIFAGIGVTFAGVISSKNKAKKNTGDSGTEEPKVTIPMTGTAAPTPTSTPMPTLTPAPDGAKSFLSVYTITDATGKKEVEHYGYDEYGRKTHFDRSDGMVMDTVYEKSGAIIRSTYKGSDVTAFYRDPVNVLPGEDGLIAPSDSYELEYDDKGYWKSISFVNENGVYIRRKYYYREDGKLGQIESYAATEKKEEALQVYGGIWYTYDDEGRITSYYVMDLLNDKYDGIYSPAEYTIEYTVGSKKITKKQMAQTVSEEEWVYLPTGTMHTKKTYKDDKAYMSKFWIIPMPESYKEVREMSVGIDKLFEEDGYPIGFMCDEDGRVTQVVASMPSSGIYDFPIISVKYDGYGRLISITDELSVTVTTFEYDEHGDVCRSTAYDEKADPYSDLILEYERIKVKELE